MYRLTHNFTFAPQRFDKFSFSPEVLICGSEASVRKSVSRRAKVLLFYPPYGGPPLGAPLCLLVLTSPLLQAGFEVKLKWTDGRSLLTRELL